MKPEILLPEVESSRTHFEVLGLGLEDQVLGPGLKASSPRKLPCPRLEDSTIFWTVEISLEKARNLAENLRIPFWFSFNWSIGVAKEGRPRGPGPPIEISSMTKMWQKCVLFFQFQFLISIFRLQQKLTTILKTTGPRPPSTQFLPANLNV